MLSKDVIWKPHLKKNIFLGMSLVLLGINMSLEAE